MAANAENEELQIELLELSIVEQKLVYHDLNDNYRQIKVRTIAFLGAGFAVMTFLYSSGEIFYPKQTYGKLFYLSGLGLVIAGFSLLFVALQAVHWEFPTEKERLKKLDFSSKRKYLEYIRDRYLLCYSINASVCEKKHRLLRMSFYPLVIGLIILIVLKLFKEGNICH